jgi:hypothetical protein
MPSRFAVVETSKYILTLQTLLGDTAQGVGRALEGNTARRRMHLTLDQSYKARKVGFY